MPPSRRSAVTVRSSRNQADIPDVLPAMSRVVQTTVRLGRKPSRSQRFVKESEPLIKPTEAMSASANAYREPPDDVDLDTDTILGFMHDGFQQFLDDPDDGASDASDDDILPSFGPQLSLGDAEVGDAEVDDDVVYFTHLNKEYYNKKDPIIKQFEAIHNTCIDELLRHDGFIAEGSHCCRLGCENLMTPASWFRCLDCLPDAAKCASCTVEEHTLQPFHRIEQWNEKFWRKASLTDLGLIVNLGHGIDVCPSPLGNVREMHVIDTNSIFITNVRFCGCPQSNGPNTDHYIQLLRARLFPCTISVPSSAVTFRCLDSVCRLNNQGKLTGYDYYQSQMHATDSAELDPPKKRYDEFMRTIRLWKHLFLLKRGAIGFFPGGVNVAGRGSCAVDCPACPRDFPDLAVLTNAANGHPTSSTGFHGDDDDPDDQPPPLLEVDEEDETAAWVDTEFVMLDANFRLKSKQRNLVDPPLGGGLAYYVDNQVYMAHVKASGEQTEINVCDSGLHAIDHANTRGGSAYVASGVGACQCRHMLVKPNGVGDLQKGEKYANMDFIFASAINKLTAKRLVVSYDIACQWHKNLRSRMVAIPTEYRPDLDSRAVDFVIPKFHIAAHGNSCQSKFSLNFRPHMGRTDGENIERGWAWLNPVSLSTREMGPGARQDALDDQWSFWNWRIVVSLG